MAEEKPKRKLPEALAKNVFRPGQCGNPLGRPPGAKATNSKLLSELHQVWLLSDAPEDWFGSGLELFEKEGRTVADLIAARITFCLATNVRYQNPALLKEIYDRNEGKIPLRVLHRPGDDGSEDDFSELTNEELEAYVTDLDRRARLAHAKEIQAQISENTSTDIPGSGDAESREASGGTNPAPSDISAPEPTPEDLA